MAKWWWLLSATLLINACKPFSNDVAEEILINGEPFCQATDANRQLHRYMTEWYFWNDDLPTDFAAEEYQELSLALEALKAPQDRFSFTLTNDEYRDFLASRSLGYGISIQQTINNDGLLIRLVYAESTANQVGLQRGDIITQIDGQSVTDLIAQVDSGTVTWPEIFGPDEVGVSIDISFVKPSGESIDGVLTKKNLDNETVLFHQVRDVAEQKVGYLVFKSFKERSRQELETVFDEFIRADINELVLDLRYNGGGLTDVANQLASQIGGEHVQNNIFMQMVFNDDKQSENQIDYFSLGAATQALDIDRVFVLQTDATCSASELVINALSPYLEVITIGQTTCGKPIGMFPTPICDDVVFAISFQTVNAAGFGDYFDGLAATCPVTEQIVGDWEVLSDPFYQAAVDYIQTEQCPDVTGNKHHVPIKPKRVIGIDEAEPKWQGLLR